MEKGRKLLIIAVLVTALAGLGAGAVYYYYFHDDPTIQAELTDQFGDDFFTFNTQGEEDKSDASPTGPSQPTSAAMQASPANPAAATGTSEPGPAQPAPRAQLSEADIIAKYQPRLESLQNQSNSRLDALSAAAMEEYKTRQANGTLDKSEMVKKYIQAANMLEGGVDASFHSTLEAMQAELTANGHPTTIIKEIETRYANAKAQRRAELLKKAGM